LTKKGIHESTRQGTTGYENKIGDPFSSLRLFGTVQRRQSNIPIQTTPLVDREKEFEALRDLVHQGNVRLITLTGPGGSGKTRLALEVASNLRSEFSDGVVYVSLAAVTEANLVPSEIITTLDIMEKAGEPVEDTLKEFLRGKRTLLLLDNFEQVIDAAPFAAQLLHECPELKIIVTSRAPLRVQGEHEFPILPLAVPDLTRIPAAQELVLNASVALFVQRARAIRANFAVTRENSKALAEICTRLDGLPLALELAAARTRVLSPEDLLLRLQKRLELLTGGQRDLPKRQQTLRNTIAWSYDLLDERNKILFGRLSVFGGDFSLEAAEEICAQQEKPIQNMLDRLSRLVEQSLLLSEQAKDGIRFSMLGTIREFAHESLVSSGESVRTEESFVDYFLSFTEEAELKLNGPEEAGTLVRLDREHDNIRAALRLLIEDGDAERSLRLSSALWNFWNIRGYHTEGRVWLTKALERAEPIHSVARAWALIGAGGLAKWQNDLSAASSLLKEGLALSRELGYKRGVGYALNYLANVDDDLGNFADARRLYEESLDIFRELGDKSGIGLVLGNLGVGARNQADYERASRFHQESLEMFTRLENRREIALSLMNLGIVLERKGEYDNARKMLNESLSLFRELGARVGITEASCLFATLARQQRDFVTWRELLAESLTIAHEIGYQEVIALCFEEFAAFTCATDQVNDAVRFLAVAEAIRERIRVPIPPAYQGDIQHNVAIARSTLGEDKFQAEWAKGWSMTVEQAVAYILVLKSDGS